MKDPYSLKDYLFLIAIGPIWVGALMGLQLLANIAARRFEDE